MDHQSWNYAVDDENEEDGFQQERWGGKDHLIFMIDCSDSMMKTKMEGGGTLFESCLKAITRLYRRRCVTCDKDYLGVLLFNTEKSKNSHSFDNICVLNDLSLPDAKQVKQLESFLTKDGKKEFAGQFGHGEAKMDEAFWMAGTMFSTAQGGSKDTGTKRVMLFTNRARPHANDSDMQKRVQQKIKDLLDQDIGVEIIPVQGVGEAFDWSFYQDALGKTDAECEERAAETFASLMEKTMTKGFKRRAMANLTCSLGGGVEFGVGLYNLYSIARIPTASTLDSKTNEPVASKRTFLDADTGEKIMQVDLKKTQTYGGLKISLEKDEVDKLKHVGREREEFIHGLTTDNTAGLLVLGAKPISYLKPHHYIQPGLFAYPEERLVSGSSLLFRAILEKMVPRKSMLICRLVARSNMAPRIVALLPQLEEKDDNGAQILPPGFNVVYLPFADDIRDLQKILNQDPSVTPSKAHIDTWSAAIRKLMPQLGYDPSTISNPALQKHYHGVEAIALERETVEETEDQIQPNLEWMEKKGGEEMKKVAETCFSPDYKPGQKRKKPTGGSGGGTPAKRSNVPKAEAIDLEKEARDGGLDKLTIAVLREQCASQGIELHGSRIRKGDIIETIKKHFGL